MSGSCASSFGFAAPVAAQQRRHDHAHRADLVAIEARQLSGRLQVGLETRLVLHVDEEAQDARVPFGHLRRKRRRDRAAVLLRHDERVVERPMKLFLNSLHLRHNTS